MNPSETKLENNWAQNILPQRSQSLDMFFAPKTVAVIGATETPGSVGRTILENLVAGKFPGAIYPVNLKRSSVLGIKAYASITAVPIKPDLVIIATPPQTVPDIIFDCAKVGVQGAIIISSGFKEIGNTGVDLEKEILTEARRGKIRIIGPNCLGVMSPHGHFNGTFAAGMAKPGNVGFISQSGALYTAILDWSLRENVGFSTFVSVGSMLDVGWGDLIYHLGDDPNTRSIVIYMESIGDARAFLTAAREVALTKPIIVLKAGRTGAAAKAAALHTGSFTGSDEVLQAAFERAGVLRVETISELVDMAEVLAKQPRPKGPRLTIVTNAGGPGVLAADALTASGAKLAELTPETLAALNRILPPMWSHNNPVDIIGDAGPERYAEAVKLAAKDPNTDGLLVVLTPHGMTDPTGTAKQLVAAVSTTPDKPVLASWMGAREVERGEDILNAANIPTFKFPDRAARAFHHMWRYADNLRALYETPMLAPDPQNCEINHRRAAELLETVRQTGRTTLTENESKRILQAYGIPVVEALIAQTEIEAVKLAAHVGFPVVLKLHSETITDKTAVGGVHLNLRTAAAVRQAWRSIQNSVTRKTGAEHFLGVTVQPMIRLEGNELTLSSSVDAQFGPVLLFGAGGKLGDIFNDHALGLPPLNATLARLMMERTRIFSALNGVRGRKPTNVPALEQVLIRFSQLVVDQPWISEININPLFVSAERIYALDARVVLHPPGTRQGDLPRPAIRPYPTQYVAPWKLKDKTSVLIRPIRPEDEPLMVKFHESLSAQSVYGRYYKELQLSQRVAHERLIRICFNDYDREVALVAEHRLPRTNEPQILGIGRLSKTRGANEAEFALIVSDHWQNQGLGTELLKRLVQVAREERLDRMVGRVVKENHAIQRICKSAGFHLHQENATGAWKAEIDL